MNKTIRISEQPVSDRHDITLMDGRTLSCVLKPEQPIRVKPDTLRIDTTGQYFVIGGKQPYNPPETLLERGLASFGRRIFRENAWLLYGNAKRILTTGTMFLTPLKVSNNLAYFGTNGLKNPTVGVYIEWWMNYPNVSTLREGLIWQFAGSPLSGTNSCSVITPENRKITVHTRPFSDIWRSFMAVNTRYTEAKQRCEAYTLEELLILLRGVEYGEYLDEIRQEEIDLTVLYNNKPARHGYDASKRAKSNRRTLMQTKWRQIVNFHDLFQYKEREVERIKNESDRKQYLQALHSLAEFATESMETLYGRNIMDISLDETISFAKYKKSQMNVTDE